MCQKNKLSKQVHVRMHVYMYVYKYVCLHVLYCTARGPELVQLWCLGLFLSLWPTVEPVA